MTIKRHRLKEFIIDPSSREFSMSRICLPVILLIDFIWMLVCIKGVPPTGAMSPVSSMLGIATGAVCGVYGVNSGGGSFGRSFGQAIVNLRGGSPPDTKGITPS